MKTALFFCLLLAAPAWAQRNSGRAGHDFDLLLEPSGARPAALGHSYEAVAEGAQGWLYNPAGAGQGRLALSLDHELWLAGATHERLSLVSGAADWGALGLQAGLVNGPQSELRDANGVRIGSFQGRDWSFGLGWSLVLAPGLSLGAGLNALSQALPGKNRLDFAWDLGLLAGQGRPWSAGLVLHERPGAGLDGQRRIYTGALSGAWRFSALGQQGWIAALSARLDPEAPGEYSAGLELPYAQGRFRSALRGGYSLQVPSPGAGLGNQASVGAGLSWGAWTLDYTYLPLGADLGGTQQLSLSWQAEAVKEAAVEAAPDPVVAVPQPQPALPAPLSAPAALATEFHVLSDAVVAAQDLERQGRNHDALNAYLAAVKADSKDGPAWEGLGRVYRALGRSDYAEQAEARVRELQVR